MADNSATTPPLAVGETVAITSEALEQSHCDNKDLYRAGARVVEIDLDDNEAFVEPINRPEDMEEGEGSFFPLSALTRTN